MESIWTDSNLRTVEANYREQRSSRWMYLTLTKIDTDETRRRLLLAMASFEERHASRWASLLERFGRPLPRDRKFLSHRFVVALARFTGVEIILPLLHRQEVMGIAQYKIQAQKWTDPFVQDLFREILPDEVYYEINTVNALRKTPVHHGSLRSAVLGANDGLATVLAVTVGVVGATHTATPAIIAGVAALLSGAVSMGAAGYLSIKAENEVVGMHRQLEEEAITVAPEAKKKQLEESYREKGLTAEEASTVVRRLMQNPKRFVHALLVEKQRLNGGGGMEEAGRLALYTTLAFFLAGAIPLLPFLFFPVWPAIIVAVVWSGIGLFLAGVLRTLWTAGSFARSGAEMVLVGMGVAALTYVVGGVVGQVIR